MSTVNMGEVQTSNAYVLYDTAANVVYADSIDSVTRVGSVATATKKNHGYPNGKALTISGFTQPEYNGNFTIANVTPDTWEYTITGTPAFPGTGAGTVTDVNSSMVTAAPKVLQVNAIPAGTTVEIFERIHEDAPWVTTEIILDSTSGPSIIRFSSECNYVRLVRTGTGAVKAFAQSGG